MMKPILNYACLLLLVVLTSFSGKKEHQINIVFIGDSITEGGALADPKTEATPLHVAELLRQRKDISAVNISNKGFSGHTTVDFLPKNNIDFPKVVQAANSFAQDKTALLLFSIMLGTNDSAMFGPNGAPVQAAQYKDNLNRLINALMEKYPQAKFVLQYPLWYSPNTHNNAGYMQEGLDRLNSYFPQIETLFAEYKLSHPNKVYLGSKDVFSFFQQHHKKMFKPEDGKYGVFYLHPNAEGAKALAEFWVKGIIKSFV
ncbi:GDSL-type esterase/lipase family protein [Pedobacter gandavensis]|uniref:GDSL-type esterase/lipase family protein n=1 Tax=Pedobacter TaxID=84567 RepID=UPI001C9A18CD|nr:MULTISPECIES: GDSL-type esterase/lipase family protein [Pedobacter]WGQ09133.1 GDSL-type esterase/lipase family protein [Pedobacter gandavensis]